MDSSRSHTATPPLTDLDHRILSLLARHRVLTQNQLAAIEPGTPVRTLRYRCARLAKSGLAGRTRPYRERGSASWLERRAEEDCGSRAEQKRLATDYLGWREGEARRLLKAEGLTARLSKRPEDFLDRIDRRSLRRCKTCEEIVYPDPERTEKRWGAKPEVAERCHFCGTTALAELGEGGER